MKWTNDYRRGDPDEKGRLTYFVYDDLESRQHGGHQPVICYYDDLGQALGAYKYLSTAHKEWMTALGGQLDGGAFDFVQRRGGEDKLVNDWKVLGSWGSNPDVHKAVREIASELGLEDKSLDKLKEQAAERAAEKNAERPHPGKAKDPDLGR